MFMYSYVVSRPHRFHARVIGPAALPGVAALFKVLGDPSRLTLLDLLSHGERPVAELAEDAGLSESATSHQLRVLRAARLVRTRRDGRHMYYALDDMHVARLLKDAAAHATER
jgi:DNA-binding transcriptional ArsR family regulator